LALLSICLMENPNKTKKWMLIIVGGLILFFYKTCTGQLPPFWK